MTSYCTADEWTAVHNHFAADSPPRFERVSQTQLSVARHSGAATVNGNRYIYIDATDELIRDDVLRYVRGIRKKQMTAPPPGRNIETGRAWE